MIAEIQARLVQEVAALKLVAGATEFGVASESNPPATPAAYVIRLRETGGPRATFSRVEQRVPVEIGIVLVTRNVADAKGAAAGVDMEALRSAVRTGAAGLGADRLRPAGVRRRRPAGLPRSAPVVAGQLPQHLRHQRIRSPLWPARQFRKTATPAASFPPAAAATRSTPQARLAQVEGPEAAPARPRRGFGAPVDTPAAAPGDLPSTAQE